MTDKQPTDPALNDAVRSIRETGESADTGADKPADADGEPNPNPPLPDWGTDGVPDE